MQRAGVRESPQQPANNLAANGEVNTVEDLEAIWASAPAPKGGKVLATA